MVLVSTAVAYYLEERWGLRGALVLTGPVDSGVPTPQMPWKFGTNSTQEDGEDDLDGPLEMGADMAVGVVMIAMVSMLQHIAIVKFYARE